MIALVIVKAIEPAAKASFGFILVARVRSNRASLSVSSAMKIAENTVRKAVRRSTARYDHSLNEGVMIRLKVLSPLVISLPDGTFFSVIEDKTFGFRRTRRSP